MRLCLANLTLAFLWDAWSSSAAGHMQLKASLAWLERQDYCFHVKPGQGNVTGFLWQPAELQGVLSSRMELQ